MPGTVEFVSNGEQVARLSAATIDHDDNPIGRAGGGQGYATGPPLVIRWPTPPLWVMPAGTRPPDPFELLSSQRIDKLLAQFSADFDMVIIDTSPVMLVADALALIPRVDTVLLVSSLGDDKLETLEALGERVRGAKSDAYQAEPGWSGHQPGERQRIPLQGLRLLPELEFGSEDSLHKATLRTS